MDADQETRALLRAYGKASEPSPEARERAWASLAAATAIPAPAGAAPPPASAMGWKLGLVITGLAVGGLALVAGLRGGEADTDALVSAPAPVAGASASAEVPALAAEAHEEVPTPEVLAVPAEAASPEDSSSSASATGPSRARDREEASAPPAEALDPPAATLGEELRLLRRARSALGAGESGAALSALDEHAARFPAGVLAAERDVTRVLVLCETGRGGEARAFASRHDTPAMARALTRCESEPQP